MTKDKHQIKCPHCGEHFIHEPTLFYTKFNFKKSLIDLGIDSEIVEDWIKVRKTKRATNTNTALKSIIKQIKLSGKSANECITLAVENSWSGFKAEWINNLNNGAHKQDNKQDNGHQFTIIK